MNKFIIFLTIATLGTTSLTWGASYLLHLKNGHELRTSYYWESGDEIKFFIYGGIVGIQKGFVTKVTSLEWNYKEAQNNSENTEENRTSESHPGRKLQETAQIPEGSIESKWSKNAEKDTEVNFDSYRERKASLKAKLEDALQRNREAIAKKDQQAKDLTRKEYLDYSRQIIELGDQLKQENKGNLPEWWAD